MQYTVQHILAPNFYSLLKDARTPREVANPGIGPEGAEGESKILERSNIGIETKKPSRCHFKFIPESGCCRKAPLQLTPACPVLKAQWWLGDRQTEMQYEELRINREASQRTRVPSSLTDTESDPRTSTMKRRTDSRMLPSHLHTPHIPNRVDTCRNSSLKNGSQHRTQWTQPPQYMQERWEETCRDLSCH